MVEARTRPAIGAVAVCAAALLFAAPATADPTDDAFVAALKNRGIVFPTDAAAITTAHNVCDGLDKGRTPASMILSLGRQFSARQAGYFVGASVAFYCPEHKGDTGIVVVPPDG
jgi:hypothetical protein